MPPLESGCDAGGSGPAASFLGRFAPARGLRGQRPPYGRQAEIRRRRLRNLKDDMLTISGLTYRIGGRLLFDGASANVPKDHRVAVVGHNGTGKTTLLRLILGELAPDGGRLEVPPAWRVARLAQEAPDGDASLLDTVLAADRERADLLSRADAETRPDAIAEIQTRLADIGAHAAPARAAAILAGLGFDDAAQARPVGSFSGGWRMRVALAAVLFQAPDLLLLDEPTNYLDLEAAFWLEGYLKSYRHTLLLVSHDRGLLNRVPTAILHLEDRKLAFYTGGYDQFERARRADRERRAAQAARQETERARMQAFVDRFRYKASKARQAQSRLKALERMEPVVPLAADQVVRFDFPEPEPVAPPLIALEDASCGYDGAPVLGGLNLRLDMDDRIAILGANGQGKSTLVKLLAGRLEPLAGRRVAPRRLRIGYFAQHQADELDLALTALDEARRAMPDAADTAVRSQLGRFGLSQQRAETRVGDLSGGEKARLLLALMSRTAPHLLLLDEPTNHLDIDSRSALIDALNAYAGAVVLITHDPHLIELTADRLWLVRGGRCRVYDGDLDAYRRLLAEDGARPGRAGGGGGGGGAAAAASDTAGGKRERRRAAADVRAALAPLRQAVRAHERTVEVLTREQRTLEARLAETAQAGHGGEAIAALQITLGEVTKRLTAAEEAWLDAAEQLETQAAALAAEDA